MSSRDMVSEGVLGNLLELRMSIEHPWIVPTPNNEADRVAAVELGQVLLRQLEELMKLALDFRDGETFRGALSGADELLDDVWVDPRPEHQTPAEQELTVLREERDVRRLGLAMWAVHLLRRKPLDAPETPMLGEVFRLLSARFTDVEQVLDVFERARDRDRDGGRPWTRWYGERQAAEDTFVPSATFGLLQAALLIATSLIGVDAPPLRPRAWMPAAAGEVHRAIEDLSADIERWAWPGLDRSQLELLGRLVDEARAEQEALARAEIRRAGLGTVELARFVDGARRAMADARVVRDVLAHQGALQRVAPSDSARDEPIVIEADISKSAFLPGASTTNLDLLAGDLGRLAIVEEQRAFASTLAQVEWPPRELSIDALVTGVRAAISGMRSDGHRPSLLLLPIAWRLRAALELPVGVQSTAAGHPLVPQEHAARMAGVLDDVPAIALAQVPPDRFYLVDVPAAIRWLEWPEDSDDGTAMAITIRDFDFDEATLFVHKHPEWEEQFGADAVATRQEQVRVTCRAQFRVEITDPRGVQVFAVPSELQRRAG